MKKIVMFCVISINSLFAYEIADSFQYPVSTSDGIYNEDKGFGWFVAQDHQDCRKQAVPTGITPCRHLGEDWNYYDGKDYSNGGRTIVAVANGYVVKAGVKKGFAGYIILKHYLNSNDSSKYVLSIYGHVKTSGLPNKGTYFKKGQILTKTATHTEMKKWTTFDSHLHFEIRKSKTLTGYEDSYLNDGYDKSNKYYDPTDVGVYDYEKRDIVTTDWNTEKGFIESYKPANNSSSTSSNIDGAGSLIRPEILGTINESSCTWGCYRDEADMQVHSYNPSTVSFQWKKTNNCKKLKIGVMASEAYRKKYNTWINPHKPLKVKIYTKEWNSEVVSEAFKTTLPKTVDYVAGWNNIIVTSQQPLSKVQEIIAECTDNDDGKDVTMLNDETTIELPLEYKLGGQSSVIRGSNKKYNGQIDGIYQDKAIGLSDSKAMSLFQWQTSTNCKSLVLKSGDYPNGNGISTSVNGINIKFWSDPSWSNTSCNNKLPCTIKAPSNHNGEYGDYYIIKVKTNANTLDGNRISAVCKE